MPQRMYLINDPDFSEYCFHCLINAPRDKINDLDTSELKHFKDQKSIRRFADGETLEKRLIILMRLGYSFTLRMAPEGADLTVFDQIPTQFEDDSRLGVVRSMNEKKIFVFGSRELLMTSHMAAQNSHSQVYILNYDYAKLRDKINRFTEVTLNDRIRDSLSAFDDLSKLVMHAMIGLDNCHALTGVTEEELRVLLAMLPYRNTFMTAPKVSQIVNEAARSSIVPKLLESMAKKGFVEKTKGKRERRLYTIMEKGINAAMHFLKYVVKHANE